MQSIPVVGTYLSFFLFGGQFPGEAIIPRLYTIHVLLLPGIFVALFTAHMLMLVAAEAHPVPRARADQRQRRRLPVLAGLPGQGRRLLLHRLRRHRAAVAPSRRSTRSGCTGRTTPRQVTAGSQPDWYMGFPRAPCGMMPDCWSSIVWGYTLSPQRLHPGADPARRCCSRSLGALPVHRVLGHRRQARAPPPRPPAQRPDPHRRSASMAISFYLVLWSWPAATTSSRPRSTCRSTTSPTASGCCSSWCRRRLLGDQADLPRAAAPGPRHCPARPRDRPIVRLRHGEFFEVHEPLDEYEPLARWSQHERPSRCELPPAEDENGVRRRARRERLRRAARRFYFDDRVEPVTPAELEAAHHGRRTHAGTHEGSSQRGHGGDGASSSADRARVERGARARQRGPLHRAIRSRAPSSVRAAADAVLDPRSRSAHGVPTRGRAWRRRMPARQRSDAGHAAGRGSAGRAGQSRGVRARRHCLKVLFQSV